jgi:cytoskeletal protein CcmA (bactofilin family)
MPVNYFSQPKNERDMKIVKPAAGEQRPSEAAAPGRPAADIVSTLGHGMLVTGNIVCAGSLHIFGRVVGDIHASNLVISDEGRVEGKIVAPDTVIKGKFHGSLHSNNVKLQSTAVVDGEIFNKTLAIEQNALFEGVSRRLEKAVEAPSGAQAASDRPATSAHVVALADLKANA